MGTRKKVFLAGFVSIFLIVGLIMIWRVYSNNNENEASRTMPNEVSQSAVNPEEEARRQLIEAATATEEDTLSEEDRKALVLSATAPEKSENTDTKEQYRAMIENATAPEQSSK